MASEAARNFLSRLRIGFLDTAEIPDDGTDRTADLVALQDVVARNAKLVWKKAPEERHPNCWIMSLHAGPGAVLLD